MERHDVGNLNSRERRDGCVLMQEGKVVAYVRG